MVLTPPRALLAGFLRWWIFYRWRLVATRGGDKHRSIEEPGQGGWNRLRRPTAAPRTQVISTGVLHQYQLQKATHCHPRGSFIKRCPVSMLLAVEIVDFITTTGARGARWLAGAPVHTRVCVARQKQLLQCIPVYRPCELDILLFGYGANAIYPHVPKDVQRTASVCKP